MTSNNKSLYVLGHKITPKEITGNYDLILGETPSQTPGPPPHHHRGYHEVFIVVSGHMDFIVDGRHKTVGPGESVDLPTGTLHTFSNNTDQPCQWVNIHSPKGFLSFFKDFGIPVDTDGAMQASLGEELINKVMQKAVNYDMNIIIPESAKKAS